MKWIRSAWRELLDAVYPPRCAACSLVGCDGWCEECAAQVEYIAPPVCPRCGTPISAEEFCASCAVNPLVLEAVRAAAYYHGVVQTAIHYCKYGFRPTIAPALAELLVKGWHTALTEPLHAAEAVIPIPIHRTRERERGFNQSALIAKHFCASTGLPLLCHVLTRTVYRQPQVGLDAEERRQNVKDAFCVVNPQPIQGRNVLIVDDVWTTGSTLNEAARALLSAGAARIFAYTVAHEPL